MRMALGRMKIKKSERSLAKLLGTTIRHGTRNERFVRAVKHYNLEYYTKNKSSLKELDKLIKRGYVIIVCYLALNRFGHFAVVKKIEKNYIYLLDPLLGPRVKYKKKYFTKVWVSEREKEKRWFIALRKKN